MLRSTFYVLRSRVPCLSNRRSTNPMMSYNIRSCHQNQMEKTCAVKCPVRPEETSNYLISNTFLPSQSILSCKVVTLPSYLNYIITIMSFLTTIRASSRQAIRTNFAAPASTFHFSAVRSLNEDDRSQYTTTIDFH